LDFDARPWKAPGLTQAAPEVKCGEVDRIGINLAGFLSRVGERFITTDIRPARISSVGIASATAAEEGDDVAPQCSHEPLKVKVIRWLREFGRP